MQIEQTSDQICVDAIDNAFRAPSFEPLNHRRNGIFPDHLLNTHSTIRQRDGLTVTNSSQTIDKGHLLPSNFNAVLTVHAPRNKKFLSGRGHFTRSLKAKIT